MLLVRTLICLPHIHCVSNPTTQKTQGHRNIQNCNQCFILKASLHTSRPVGQESGTDTIALIAKGLLRVKCFADKAGGSMAKCWLVSWMLCRAVLSAWRRTKVKQLIKSMRAFSMVCFRNILIIRRS